MATDGVDVQVLRRLVTEREPTNIDGDRLYDKKKLRDAFDYDTSYYQRYWDEFKNLTPNFAVYTEAITQLNGVQYNVHIYNAIGYAFDSPLHYNQTTNSWSNQSSKRLKYSKGTNNL